MTQDPDVSAITNAVADVTMIDNDGSPSYNEAVPLPGIVWGSGAYVDPPVAAFGPMFPTNTENDASTSASIATPNSDSQAAPDGEGDGFTQASDIVCVLCLFSNTHSPHVGASLLLHLRTFEAPADRHR